MCQREEFEDIRRVIIIRKTEGQTTIYKADSQNYRSSDMIPTEIRGELGCSERVSSSCSTSDTHRVNLVTNPVMLLMRKGSGSIYYKLNISWSFVTQIFHNGQPSQGGDRKSDDFNLTNRNPCFSSFFVSSNPLSKKS